MTDAVRAAAESSAGQAVGTSGPSWAAAANLRGLYWRCGWLAGPISALLLILSFPVFPRLVLWPLAWVALVPLLLYLQEGGWRRGVLQAILFGYPFMVGVLAWVDWMGKLPWLLLAVTQLVYVVVFTFTTAILTPLGSGTPAPEEGRSWRNHFAAVLIPASAWVVMEWLRTLGRLSIPWGFLSNTQIKLTPLVGSARWWGAFGVSFLIVAFNAALANYLRFRKGSRSCAVDRHRAGIVLAGAAAAPLLGCLASLLIGGPAPGRPLRVSLIQGNIFKEDPRDPSYRSFVLSVYENLSRQAARQRPDLIVWPETVVPGPLTHDLELQQSLGSLAQSLHTWFLVGSPSYDPLHFDTAPFYNAAFLLSPEGLITGEYDKEHLVPFGEYVPGRSWLPLLSNYDVPQKDLSSGRGHAALESPLGKIGVMICYESMYPEIARQTTRSGADILFVITNDQWFGQSSAPFDHAAEAAFRAAETGRWVVQDASTGISLFADPAGRIYQSTAMFTRTTDTRTVFEQSGMTLYTRLGDWPPFGAILFLAITFALRFSGSPYRDKL